MSRTPVGGPAAVDGNDVSPRTTNDAPNAREFGTNSDRLSTRVQKAVDWGREAVGGQAAIRVTPRPDGTPYEWGDLELDFVDEDSGLILDIDDEVEIDYVGDGWALSVNASDDTGINTGARTHIRGGKWRATGSETGWLRLTDAFRTIVAPTEVRFENGTGVQLRNENRWTENTQLTGSYRVARGFEFVPASQTGGTGGSDSFHDTCLLNPQISASDYCVKTGGVFQYVGVVNGTFQPTASGGDALLFDHRRAEGSGFVFCKAESPADPGNVAAINSTTRFDDQSEPDPTFYPPRFMQCKLNGFGIDEVVRSGSDADPPRTYSYGGRHIFGFAQSGTVADLDRNGNLQIKGSLTENTTDSDLYP